MLGPELCNGNGKPFHRLLLKMQSHYFNAFQANVSILYALKTPGVFRGYKIGTLARIGLKCLEWAVLNSITAIV